ncbi:membrane protein [Crucian carp herpesvirus]|uniref:Membrane ORF153A n=1 Tax=Cyprinid herpesvirus 2 TaxID=317878 RepID=K7PBH3_CYHV2|nr:membrane protein ORF153A [Cyprinid herpesvirus 2]APD51594.1 membrane protein [Crucian carp herpesvirus]AFJ20579.1 membrane protein ORF153A [Cyprinid herpesvirus 2]AKC02095.1 hypothetical protein [Cyprinid herpesvirus 2]AMB21723.1 membrane ORF153A [Cyprinid herpesvirus 2]QAU54875.1 membrane protein ORF153A [Cyprinid herpesvirus 2]
MCTLNKITTKLPLIMCLLGEYLIVLSLMAGLVISARATLYDGSRHCWFNVVLCCVGLILSRCWSSRSVLAGSIHRIKVSSVVSCLFVLICCVILCIIGSISVNWMHSPTPCVFKCIGGYFISWVVIGTALMGFSIWTCGLVMKIDFKTETPSSSYSTLV